MQPQKQLHIHPAATEEISEARAELTVILPNGQRKDTIHRTDAEKSVSSCRKLPPR